MIFKALFGRKEDSVRSHRSAAPRICSRSPRRSMPRSSAPSRSSSTSSTAGGRATTPGAATSSPRSASSRRWAAAASSAFKDGSEQVWGKVLAFDRPHHIVIAWQISPDRTPEDSDATASRVDVRFSPGDAGKTNVLVVHRDFFRHQGDWEKYRNDMASRKGWPPIMAAYAKAGPVRRSVGPLHRHQRRDEAKNHPILGVTRADIGVTVDRFLVQFTVFFGIGVVSLDHRPPLSVAPVGARTRQSEMSQQE